VSFLSVENCFTAELQTWPVNIHDKIFADTAPEAAGTVVMQAARNEYESGQFGVFSTEDVQDISLSVSCLTHEDGTSRIDAEQIRLRPIGMIHITKNTPEAEKIVVRKAPCDIPEVLYEDQTISLTAGESKGIWVTVFVPADAKPGMYQGTITLASENVRAEIPVQLEVFAFTLPSERHLWMTNWFNAELIAKVHGVEVWTEEFWTMLEGYFTNMAEHRQNIVITPWTPDNNFVKATIKSDGSWDVDFSRMIRFIELAEKCGAAERIEFSHCGGVDRQQHVIVVHNAVVYDESKNEVIHVGPDVWLEPVLKELENWLVETGRIDKAMIHIADEPFMQDMASWHEVSQRVHQYAPKIKRIDAIEAIFFGDDLEVLVPKISHLSHWFDEYKKYDRKNHELWYYICCHPYGISFPNRFMDLPAIRVRSLHWMNYTEDLCGYLHWGYSYWFDDPFGPPTEMFGPGDGHVVYPGPLDSIRWEVERESVEDYEYLVLLRSLIQEKKDNSGLDLFWLDPGRRGMEIGRRMVHSLTDVEMDSQMFADARLELAREIESYTSGDGPWLIVQSFPEDNARIAGAPLNIEIYGWTTPGATVTVNGNPLEVDENGLFICPDSKEETHSLEFISTLNGKSVKTTRNFVIY